jgi:ATP-binding cassette subfamily F protein uup
MNYLSVNNLAKSFGEFVLFEKISFGLDKGKKVGLVAKNGAGKSTLLKMLLGSDAQDAGDISYREGVTVGCLEQETDFGNAITIEDFIYNSKDPSIQLIKKYEDCMSSGDTESDRFIDLMDKIEELNAWGVDVRVNEVLTNLKFHDKGMLISSLSGGQARRLGLAKCLIESPDVLFLDEPTNHLDFGMVEWLEKFVQESQFSLLLITHDRYFLDNVCDEIIELSVNNMFHYKGDYEYYLNKKAERDLNTNIVANKAKNLYKSELDWLRKQPKARGTKSKSRIQAAGEIKKTSKTAIQTNDLEISSVMSRMGSKIIEIEHLSKAFGELKILNDFTYFFKRGEKIGIIGKNGTGKSTFLNLITGQDKVYEGSIGIGSTIRFGYYNQKGLKFRPDMKVIDVVRDISEAIEMKNGSRITASQMLTHFQFEPKKQHTHIEKLSGGERKRLYLVTVLMENPNFLILDEPTNDLDLGTLTALENYLLDFNGCVLIVSHDRYFLDRMVDHLFVFKGDAVIKDFPGNYTDYRESEKNIKFEDAKPKKVKAPKVEVKAPVNSDARKVTFKEKLELEEILVEIENLEKEKTKLENNLSSGDLSGTEINDISIELGKVIGTLEDKTMRWMELEDLAK